MSKNKNTTRSDGRIAVQVYLGRGEDGKRKYKTVYGYTQKEADEKARQIKFALSKGLDVMSANTPFKELVDAWLISKEGSISEKHAKCLGGKAKQIKATLGDYPVAQITTANIQLIINKFAKKNPHTGKPSAKKTLIDFKSCVSQVFETAIENRLTEYNPAKYAKIPSKAPKETRFALTKEEQKRIEDTPHDIQRAAMIMMFSGLRRGELIPLTWNDIDFKENTISVNKSVEMINGKPTLKDGGKTEYSTRVIDIPQKLIDFLKYEKSGATVFQLVCPNDKGEMFTETQFRRKWDSYIKELNFKYGNKIDKTGKLAKSKYNPNGIEVTIRKFTPHCLRHTFATMLYLAGVDVLTAKEQLGHKDIKTTLSIYTHLDKAHKRKNISKLDEFLNDASQMQVSDTENLA